jgi:hypothetical protein
MTHGQLQRSCRSQQKGPLVFRSLVRAALGLIAALALVLLVAASGSDNGSSTSA